MPVWEELEDIELIKLAQKGEAEAFGQLYERYVKLIFRYVYAHSNDRLDAEDLTEEVFIRVLRSLRNYQEQGVPFAAYLYRIARNVLIDHHRRLKFSGTELQYGDDNTLNFLPGAYLDEDGIHHQELRQVLEQLRDDYREVLILRFLSDFSPEETALTMDRSVGAVRVLQHRALSALKKLMVGSNGTGKEQ